MPAQKRKATVKKPAAKKKVVKKSARKVAVKQPEKLKKSKSDAKK